MKKFMRGMLCLMLVLCMMMCFAACDEEKRDKSIAGTYYFLEMTIDGETYDREMMEEIGMDYKDMYIKFNKDGTGKLVTDDSTEEFEWDDEVIDDGIEPIEYTYKNNKITIEYEGVEMVFERD